MTVAFSRTLRSLDADRPRRPVLAALAAVVLAGWAAWFALAEVTVYEVSTAARLEVACAAVPVSAEVGGRVASADLTIGREVRAGDLLAVLDAHAERLALAERTAKRDGLTARLAAVRDELRAEADGLPLSQKARAAAVAEAKAKVVEAESRVRFAEQQVQRLGGLRTSGAVSADELTRAETELAVQRASVRTLTEAVGRLDLDRLGLDQDRVARVAKLRGAAAELDGEAAVEAAAVRRLEYELDRRTVRAPAAGRVGSAGPRVGAVVAAGERLATLVPAGDVRVVAYFPATAAGRLRAGQPARLRLDAFPWTVYGTVPVTVAAVADEPTDGRLRIELSLSADGAVPVAAEHGLSGSAEVAVERTTPLRIALRAAGQFRGGAGR